MYRERESKSMIKCEIVENEKSHYYYLEDRVKMYRYIYICVRDDTNAKVVATCTLYILYIHKYIYLCALR